MAAFGASPACDLGGSSAASCPPQFASASGSAVYVSAACGSDAGDGSLGAPLRTIGAAVARAQTGTTILVAAGTYSEDIKLPGGVHLIGQGAVRITPNVGGLAVWGEGQSTLSGLTIRGAKGEGISVQKTAVRLERVIVEETTASASAPGSGVVVEGSPSVELSACQIRNNAGFGVRVHASGPTSIIDPLFHGDPRSAGGTGAIIDPLFMPASVIGHNLLGGVAIIDPLFVPNPVTADLLLHATLVHENGQYGVLLQGASGKLAHSAVAGTLFAGDVADGVAVLTRGDEQAAPNPTLSIDKGSLVLGNGRVGVNVATYATATIDGEVSLSGRGGVWGLGYATTITLSKSAALLKNTMVGVAVTNGAHLICDGAHIAGTMPRAVSAGSKTDSMADGIGIYGAARGVVTGATLADNPRAGLVASKCGTTSDGEPDVSVTGTQITGSKFEVVIQCPFMPNGAMSTPKDPSASSDSGEDGKNLIVPDSFCDNGSLDPTCTP
ncbi:MAG: right-handed parallel beta-helix repeat-containing protein [Deltaproteobacteria bacterium]|nr:right-handed parallel beta-helix repeat-containing protein [Deltaproteobacteria bacterium]